MRTAWLLSLLVVTFYACSDDGDGGDGNGNTAGNGGSANTAGGSGGGSFAGSGGRSTAGTGGNAVGAGGSNMAGSGGSNASGMGGSGGMGSGATGCTAFCERSLDECTADDPVECFDSCDNSARLCPPESAALIACVLPRPDSDFHCEMGITTPNDDVCDAEATALLACLFAGF